MSSRPDPGASRTDRPTARRADARSAHPAAPATRATVVVGGPAPSDLPPALGPVLSEGARLVVAVDSGLHHAVELRERGWVDHIDLVVGDLDSVDHELLAAAERSGSDVQRHPVDKDATDLELALDHLLALGVGDTVVVAGAGGRLDHLLAGALVLGSARYAPLGISAWFGGTQLIPVHDRTTVVGRPGATISLVATHGRATGVSTTGLRWNLDGEDLLAGAGRGVSNEFVAELAEVSVERGPLSIIIPQEAT